ncbi:MAG: hypothetical protein MJZ34_07200 [Paludibacteraceae bacterium]|nr:hypothetical protein [Paludibacteraceae bacterium]
MTQEEVYDFFLEYNLFAQYDSVDVGYDIYDSSHCVIATLQDNPTMYDCLMKIKDLKDSNFI